MSDTISVPAAGLRRALTAVLPHASDDDTLPSLTCVRFEARDGWLFLVATDRYSMAAARVSVPGGCGNQDALLPAKSAEALRRMLGDADGETAALDFGDGKLSVTAGESWSAAWPAVQGSEFPDWRRLLGKMLTAEPAAMADDCGLNPRLLARFTVCQDAPDSSCSEPLAVRMTSAAGPVLFTRGDWFLAALMPARRQDDGTAAGLAAWSLLADPVAEAVAAHA